MRKIFSFILVVLFTVTINAQTVSLNTYGVNPREVAADTTDIFDLTFNGLVNVGKETQMYLKGSSSLALTGATWTLITKPASSATIIGTATVADTSTEFMVFTPDVVGTYEVSFVDGGNGDTLTINAGLFLGMEGGTVKCVSCHSSTATKYMATAHATATKKQFDAMEGSSSHFGESCLECHATGYNLEAVNDGFDDHTFTFPGTFETGMYDSMKTAYPDAMARADVQCESCHGPGSEHIGNVADGKMVSSLDSKTCAACHEDAGTHHYIPTQWDASGHDATDYDERGFHGGHSIGAFVGYAGNRAGCAACHSGSGYAQWDNEGKPVNSIGLPASISVVPAGTNISCAACHDPHDATSIHQLRLSDTQLGDGTPVTFDLYGTGAQCMECHRSRRDAAVYASDPNSGSSHFGPHHGPQADMLIGANAPAFPELGNKILPSSPHAVAGGNSCVDCHMAGEKGFDDDGNVVVVGGHSFNMNDVLGNDHVEVCTPCHGEVGETFKEKKYFKNNDADHDGDGTAEGLQEEVHGMLEILATYLPQDEDGNVDMSSKTNPPAVVRAGYAYMWVEEDRSFGIHNPQFTVALLQVAIESMKYGGLDAGMIQEVTDVPMDQGFQVRIVWTAFSSAEYDQIDSYIIKRQVPDSTDLWEDVAVVPAVRYVEYAAVVPTLHNAFPTYLKVVGMTQGNNIAETEPMLGFSTDDLAPQAPSNAIAGLENTEVVVTWDESSDKDFNYFEIFRSETQGFAPALENRIATTTDIQISDAAVEDGKTYFYLVTARDFSENQSDASNEVNVTITAVDDTRMTPTEYSLDQNYPNPFNPSTTVTFGIPENADVQVIIYDMVGNKVEVLVNDNLSAGYHTYSWNAANHASGIYFCQMTTGKFTSVNKMLLIK